MKSVEVSAPSNIALIKYMGKLEANVPTNASLSYTLNHLRSYVRLTEISAEQDQWASYSGKEKFEMSEKGKMRFLNHFTFLKNELGIEGNYLVESANDFPSDCGLASSASSFAALTMAAVKLSQKDITIEQAAQLSRQGSGSSCRSFFSHWAKWRDRECGSLDVGYGELLHQVFVVESEKKLVSSSEAHKRVTSSTLFSGRVARAEYRLDNLVSAMKSQNWKRAFELCWIEFWDMHALFATSEPPFMYMTEGSQLVLRKILQFWNENQDGPIVTMDAGANVHCLYRQDQVETKKRLSEIIAKEFSKSNLSLREI